MQAIYRQQYWEKIRGDDLPPGVDYVVFDGAVNSGVAQSAKWLQRALGVRVDGIIGNATIAACWDVKDHDALIADTFARVAWLSFRHSKPGRRSERAGRGASLTLLSERASSGRVAR
ncbi:glycosyl hydrolase 108 family protein [Camelimonas abortus]|uniref:glycosyl hydrolase 108 family protein n=1 Tax=Camelimonas abortus TaxID=1017184 RepID=UPI0035E8A8EF